MWLAGVTLLKTPPTVIPTTLVQNPVVQEPIATPATLLIAVNAERAKYGVPPLVEDARLAASAQAKACDMYDNHYNAHINPSGVRGVMTAMAAMGDLPGNYNENLVWGDRQTANSSMGWWINSTLHHKGMIDRSYTLTGFGICGSNGEQIAEHFYGAK